MKIDKKTIDALLKLNDDQLWNVIQMLLFKSGNEDLKAIKRPDDMSQIRTALATMSEKDLEKAMELLKKGSKDGKKSWSNIESCNIKSRAYE